LAGRYRLIEVLGEGGMSIVWRAHDLVLDRPVAVKVLAQQGHQLNADAIRSEALASAKLSHPYIAGVFDYGETAGGPDGQPFAYVVMELLTGAPLSATPPLPVAAALRVCAEVAAAIAAAHVQGVVHRHIKPANIILTPMGAKVVDFGLAARVGAHTPESGEVLGTPGYTSPERLQSGPLTPASDVYSLGVVLYWALTHELPWPVRSAAEAVDAHLRDDPADLPDIEGVPAAVATLYRQCLARDPLLRPTAHQAALTLAAAAGIGLPGDSASATSAQHPGGGGPALLAGRPGGAVGGDFSRW